MNNGFYEWDKGQDHALSEYFGTAEFSCQCKNLTCVQQKIAFELIDRLERVREQLTGPLRITSGFRCHLHQLELSARGCETAKGLSQHELGSAADVGCLDMQNLRTLAEKEFQAIGYSKRFLHLDLRGPEIRKWYYKN